MAFNGIRDFAESLGKSGDLFRVKREEDWDRERDVPPIASFERYPEKLKEKIVKNWKIYVFRGDLPAAFRSQNKDFYKQI